jgi:hypothetical protein
MPTTPTPAAAPIAAPALTLERIAIARELALLAPLLPGDDDPARDTLANCADLLAGVWPNPEAALLGAWRTARGTQAAHLGMLARGVVLCLHGRAVERPQVFQAVPAAHLATLVDFVPGGESLARSALYRAVEMLRPPRCDPHAALAQAQRAAAAAPCAPLATLAQAVALVLCAPPAETVLAELGAWSLASRSSLARRAS